MLCCAEAVAADMVPLVLSWSSVCPRREMATRGERARAYLVEGEGVAEDEVDGALDVAVPVVVPAQVVVQRVLR